MNALEAKQLKSLYFPYVPLGYSLAITAHCPSPDGSWYCQCGLVNCCPVIHCQFSLWLYPVFKPMNHSLSAELERFWISSVMNFHFLSGCQGNESSSIFSALFFTVSPSSDVFVVEVVQHIILDSYVWEKRFTKMAHCTLNLKMWGEEQKPTDGFNAKGFLFFALKYASQL